MKETRHSTFFPKGFICYPSFSPETDAESDACTRMTAFYKSLCEAVEAASAQAHGQYIADYTSAVTDDGIQITVFLRLRHRGHTIARRTLTHQWHDGFLSPKTKPHKKALFSIALHPKSRYNK